MALSDLVSRLEQEAKARVDAIEERAADEISAIDAETERVIAAFTADHLERHAEERERCRRRELALARRQARTRELEACHAQLTRILDRARALVVETADTAAYRDAVPLQLDEALSFLEGLHVRVRCSVGDAEALRSAIARHGVEQVIDDTVGPGVVAETVDGSVTVDNTLAARLARAETRLTIELSRRLGYVGV